jgi:hypothetical protein
MPRRGCPWAMRSQPLVSALPQPTQVASSSNRLPAPASRLMVASPFNAKSSTLRSLRMLWATTIPFFPHRKIHHRDILDRACEWQAGSIPR